MASPKRSPSNSIRDIWVQNEEAFRNLYEVKRKDLKAVKRIMEEEHGFPETPLSTYETKLRDLLGLRKKLKKDDYAAIYQRWKQRRGRETGVYLNGTRIQWNKVWKEIRRSGARSLGSDPSRSLPLSDGVVVRTPSPPPVSTHACNTLLSSQMSTSREIPGTYDDPRLGTPAARLHVSATTSSIDHVSQPHRVQPVMIRDTEALPLIASSSPSNSSALFVNDPTLSSTSLSNRLGLCSKAASGPIAFFLENLPINVFRRALHVMAGDSIQSPTRYSAVGEHQTRVGFSLNILYLTGAGEFLPCSDPLFSDGYPYAPPAINFDCYYILSEALLYLSNQTLFLFHLYEYRSPRNVKISLYLLLFDRVPRTILIQLLHTGFPTVKAAWNSSVHIAYALGRRDLFSTLMEVGLQHPDWNIDGQHFLSFAALLNAPAIVRGLLKAGFLPEIVPRRPNGTNAIVAAASRGNVECADLLIAKCEANQAEDLAGGFAASHLSVFLLSLARGYYDTVYGIRYTLHLGDELSLESRILGSFLRHGPDLDCILEGGCFPSPCHFHNLPRGSKQPLDTLYTNEDLPTQLRVTLLEQVYYWSPGLIERLAPYSTKLSTHLTRVGICLSAKQGPDALCAYLESRPPPADTDIEYFLELVLAEQFMRNGHNIDTEVIRTLVELGVNVMVPRLRVQPSVLLYRLVTKVVKHGSDHHDDSVIIQLLQKGTAVDETILATAIGKEETNTLRLLLENGAGGKRQSTLALAIAARLGNYDAIAWLLKAGADINGEIPTNKGTLSIVAFAIADPNTFARFLDQDQYRDFELDGISLERAGYEGAPTSNEMVRFLLEHGARPKLHLHDPTVLDLLEFSLLNTVDHLLMERTRLFLGSETQFSPTLDEQARLLQACLISPFHVIARTYDFNLRLSNERWTVFKLLLRRGTPFQSGGLLARLIYHTDQTRLIQDFLDRGADVNEYAYHDAPHYWCMTPLQAAAARMNIELATQLLQRGANINQPERGKRGIMALPAACEWNPLTTDEESRKIAMIRYLISQGADINLPVSSDGINPLQAAIASKDFKTAIILLNHGANPNALSFNDRYTALDLAAMRGMLDMVQLLLNVGARSRHGGSTGYDGAIKLARESSYHIIEELLQKHAANYIELYGSPASSCEYTADTDSDSYESS